ncbi:MAG TPA: metallophosphoesterase, partial [Fimbriiglobus sp.]
AGALLAAGVWPGALAARDADAEPFHFVAVNDLHYKNDQCDPWFQKVAASIRGLTEKPEFLLVVGDLVENGTAAQFGKINDVLKTLDRPYHAVIGNHDYAAKTDRKAYDEACPKQTNYRFEHKGWQFVGLDTSDAADGKKYQGVTARKQTFTWLDETLPKLDKNKPTVLFTHFPLGDKVNMRLSNADLLLDRFKPLNLRAVFNGHYHALTEKTIRGDVLVTTNRCCAHSVNNHDNSKEKGYFICSAKEGKITRRFVEVKPA